MNPMMSGLDPESMMMPKAGLKTDGHDDSMNAPRQSFNPTEDGGQPASPEEQEIYDRFVAASMMVLWDKKGASKYAQALRASPDPKETAAEIAAQVGFRVVKGAAEAGTPIPAHIILSAGMEVATQVVELADKVGVKMTPQDAEQVYYMALDKGRVMAQQTGLIDQDMVGQDAAMLDRMGQDGRLEQVMGLVQQDHARHAQSRPLEDDPRSSFEEDAPVKTQGKKPVGLDDEEE